MYGSKGGLARIRQVFVNLSCARIAYWLNCKGTLNNRSSETMTKRTIEEDTPKGELHKTDPSAGRWWKLAIKLLLMKSGMSLFYYGHIELILRKSRRIKWRCKNQQQNVNEIDGMNIHCARLLSKNSSHPKVQMYSSGQASIITPVGRRWFPTLSLFTLFQNVVPCMRV